jgi:hypothetical protein
MIKTPLFLLAFAMASSGQAPAAAPPALGVATMQANVQILSAATVRAKYGMALPKGMSAASVVAENDTASMIVVGQGSIVKALRDRNYPALSRADAAAAIIHAQRSGPMGFLLENVPFGSKLLGDIEDLAVSGAIKVAPGIGVGIAIGSAVLQKLAPDIVARITQFQAS